MKRWVTYKGRTDLEDYSALPADLQQRIQAHVDAVWEWKREEKLRGPITIAERVMDEGWHRNPALEV